MDAKLTTALGALADKLDHGHLLLATNATAFVEAVTACLEAAEAEAARLRKQLPENMQDCTILFRECEKGHGRLMARNWVQHGCQWCEIERLSTQCDEWRARASRIAKNNRELRGLAAEAAELIDYSEKRGMPEYATRCAAWLDMWSSYNPAVISRR